MKSLSRIPLTLLLTGANIAVHIYLVSKSGEVDALAALRAGALFGPYSLSENSFSFLSHMFIHNGVVHLTLNMLALLSLGGNIERQRGTLVLALVYLVSGLTAACVFFYDSPFTIGMGASGAIFGLFSFYQLYRINTVHKDELVGEFRYLVFVALFSVIISIVAPVSLSAHLGGFLAGIILYYISRRRPRRAGFFSRVPDKGVRKSVLLATFFLPLLLYAGIPRFPVRYLHFFRYMKEMDEKVISVFNTSYDSLEEMEEDIRRAEPIPQHVLDSLVSTAPVPELMHSDTAALSWYWHLRKKALRYSTLEFEKETYRYRDSLWIVLDSLRMVPTLTWYVDPLADLDDAEAEVPDSVPVLPVVEELYDEDWRPVSYRSEAAYYRRGRKDSLGRWQGFVNDYYISGAIQMKGAYEDNRRHGVFILYSEDSTYDEVGRYVDDDVMGKWEDFHPNGRLAHIYRFSPESGHILSAYDTLGNATIENGEGEDIAYHLNGMVKSRRPVTNGMHHGMAEGFYPDGTLHFREFYEDGQLIRGIAIDSTGMRHAYDGGHYLAIPEGGRMAYAEYLEENNQMKSDTTDGPAIVRFDVYEDGRTGSFRILKSAGLPLDQEAIRLVKEGPAWSPALEHGYLPKMAVEEVVVHF